VTKLKWVKLKDSRTLRDKITKYFKTYQTLRWIDVLGKLISNYNNTIHSRTGYVPNKVNEKRASKMRDEEERSTQAYDVINSFKIGDKVRVLKKKATFAKGSNIFTKGIYTVDKIDKLSLILKNKDGVVLERRFKPYEVLEANTVEKVPEINIEHHSYNENKKAVRKERLRKEFDKVDNGEVVIPDRLKPVEEKRKRAVMLKVGDRVKSLFNDGGKKVLHYGVIQKINPETFTVLFEDGDRLFMKKEEVSLV
jgi:hypothetical protein